MRVFLIIILGLASLSAQADHSMNSNDPSDFAPLFGEQSNPKTFGTAQDPTPQNLERVRVLIFPHIGPYPTPQNREKEIRLVQLKTTGTCTDQTLDDTFKDRVYRFEDVTKAHFIKCDGPTTLVREAGLNSYSYTGSFILKRAITNGSENLQVINELSFDDYIKGVVPTEMPSEWPLEALKVQAIAARTYALWEILTAKNNLQNVDYDIDDTVATQAYVGLTKSTATTDQAVTDTNGIVMLFDKKIIKAYFNGDSGGITEDADHVWNTGPYPYCLGKKEVYDLSLIKSDWTVKLLPKDVSAKLGLDAPIKSIDVTSRFELGRVKEIKITLQNGASVLMSGFDFRYKLKLRSTWFSVSQDTTNFTFEGRGYGHGAGMNQSGAKALVESLGWDYAKILSFYYTGIELSHL